MRIPRGALLNSATVTAGASIGLLIGKRLEAEYLGIAMTGLGLVTAALGVKLFLHSRSVLIVAVAVAMGGMAGVALGVGDGIESFAEWARNQVGAGAGSRFSEGLIATSILFCVGPMTLIGCIQDGLEGKIELLALKSALDGIAAVFFAATMGYGVLVTALVVLVVQGALTLMAGLLRPVADDAETMGELSAAGGAILLAIGLGLLDIKQIETANLLPALLIAPLLVAASRRIGRGLGDGPR